MQSPTNQPKQASSPGLKQFKVDNWSTFFLQRLQQLYSEDELLDLTIRFPTSEMTIQAHRLVVTTCTDYFVQLERIQKENDNYDGILLMPPEMPYECVKSIISFMYTGQLEYWTSEQNALYKTAEKMNMAVLTKLLDAQSSAPITQSSPTPPPQTQTQTQIQTPTIIEDKQLSIGQQSLNSYKKTNQDLPSTPLPGRKLPIWRRKIDTPSSTSTSSTSTNDSSSYKNRRMQSTSGPSRFDLPGADDMTLGVFSSFDDITYNTKPIVKAKKDIYGHSLDSDYRDDDDIIDDRDDYTKNNQWDDNNSDDDWSGPKGILRDPDDLQPTPSKRVRFELEEKENLEKQEKNTTDSINNHAKIIREVLKKYPHLVKNNKNIRLKIMQKESKSNETSSTSGKTKVSYVVLKSDHLMADNIDENQVSKSQTVDNGENGPWKCHKCDISAEYTNYYMYRRHMQDVHEEKFDPRICEHCGYKATKRNILMYHMYTKHNVQPPKNMSFPKCHACNYVALSETLLSRHQINHNHRQLSSNSLDDIQCVECNLTFKNVNELASHEVNTGHGRIVNGKDHRGYRCQYCSKSFVRPINLQTHIETIHKNIRDNEQLELPIFTSSLEPSSEAEALSTVASGIAASLGVDNDHNEIMIEQQQQQQQQHQVQLIATSDGEGGYLVPEIDINQLAQHTNYNGHGLVEGQQMIMLIDDETYQNQLQNQQLQHIQVDNQEQQQQPQQLEISSNEQLVMQSTDQGMIVYIAGNDNEQSGNQIYQTYQEIEQNNQITEEILEEVEEEVEEVVEEVEEEVMEEINETTDNQNQNDNDNSSEQIDEEIQYVEETEIVEYDEEQGGEDQQQLQGQESMMIIEEEEEHLEGQDVSDGRIKQSSTLAADWDESSTEINES